MAINRFPDTQIVTKPLELMERDLQRDFGHWSHHIGNEKASPIKYANSKLEGISQTIGLSMDQKGYL
tara:strand:+ start:198 stop:398 length:201 start_codon:yes stop_codon:yes gene_type:complete